MEIAQVQNENNLQNLFYCLSDPFVLLFKLYYGAEICIKRVFFPLVCWR